MRRLGILLLTLAIGVLFYGITMTEASAAPRTKFDICHPVPGQGETKSGYVVEPPDTTSVHIDEETGDPKHEAEGRVDVLLGEDLLCPGEEPPEPEIVQFDGLAEPTPATCEAPGSFTLPDVLGVDFSVSPAAPPFVPGVTYTITVTLEDPDGTTFPDGTTAPKVFTVTVPEQLTGEDCEPEPTPVTPMATGEPDDCDPDPFGSITVTPVEGVTYQLQDGTPITGTIPANGTNTVTAILAPGFVLADGAQSEWTFTSEPATDCPGQEFPTPAQFSADPEPPTCEAPGSFTLPGDTDEIDFSISPAYDGPGTYTITATLNDPAAVFAANGENSISRDITVSEQLAETLAECAPGGPGPGPGGPGGPSGPGEPNNPGVSNPGNPALFAPPAAAPPAAAPPAVPTTVEAGLASTEDTGNNWGLGLMIIGMLLLGAAGTVGRPRGQHQR